MNQNENLNKKNILCIKTKTTTKHENKKMSCEGRVSEWDNNEVRESKLRNKVDKEKEKLPFSFD